MPQCQHEAAFLPPTPKVPLCGHSLWALPALWFLRLFPSQQLLDSRISAEDPWAFVAFGAGWALAPACLPAVLVFGREVVPEALEATSCVSSDPPVASPMGVLLSGCHFWGQLERVGEGG